MTAATCGACGQAALKSRYPVARDYITGDGFAVWECLSCGSARTLPVPADMSAYYPPAYRHYNRLIAAILRRLYKRRVNGWARVFAAPGSVFEMGCGNGLMLATLRDLGWQVRGSERTEDAALFARTQANVPVLVGGPENLAPSEQFDLLLMIQVLEHLEDPAAAVAAMAKHLKPDGRLIIGVPHYGSWQSRFGGATWFHLDVPRHLHHFSPCGSGGAGGQVRPRRRERVLCFTGARSLRLDTKRAEPAGPGFKSPHPPAHAARSAGRTQHGASRRRLPAGHSRHSRVVAKLGCREGRAGRNNMRHKA